MTTTAQPLIRDHASAGAAPRRSGRDTLRNALIITRREVRDSFRDWRILVPIVVLTFMFPFLAQFVAAQFADFVSDYGAQIIGERTIPFLLMIVGFFPISISLVIALETFVGEKERRSLEPLLSTPLTNTELYIGKTLAAMIPPLVSSYGGMLVYLGSLLFGELAWRPQPMLIAQIMLLTSVQALVMVAGAVVVSSQTTSTRAANLLASFIIIPMSLVIQGESFIMFIAPDAESPSGIGALWAIIAGMLVVVILLLRVGNSVFNREELLGRTIDQLNLRAALVAIWRATRAIDERGTPARSVFEWYRRGVTLSVRRLGMASWVTLFVFVVAFGGGLLLAQLPQWQLPLPRAADFATPARLLGRYIGVDAALQTDSRGHLLLDNRALPSRVDALLFFVTTNGRILLAATLLAIFSFGVAALIMTPAVYIVLGYLLGQVLIAGYNPSFMLAAILPHGVVEIPVIVLATAAGLRLGAVVTRVPEGKTVGDAWTLALGDTLKIACGLVLPGLIFAGFLESFLTPYVLYSVLS
ncbi:MAG: stage II sporulation protein M [Chloroflexi bacterium]|nr:stage II sporulation protein M [Chloroflexota bacterium]